MPISALSNFQWNGPCSAAMVVSDAVGTMQATAYRTISPSLSVTGVGTVHVMRPYRCRNAALVAEGVGTVHVMNPKRWVRAGLEVAVNELTADDVAGALQTMKVEGSITFAQLCRALLSIAANNATGIDGPNAAFKSRDGSKTRIAATLSGGNRTVNLLDLD